jgi:cytochrome c55X
MDKALRTVRPLLGVLVMVLSLASQQAIADIDATRQKELKYLLTQDCGSCHGLTLKGGLGPALLPQALKGKSREFLIMTILKGRPGTAMPPWEAMLSQDEAAWLADQLLQDWN